MFFYKITADEAAAYQQTKKFGIISEGCTGVWGQGDTMNEAEAEAIAQIRIAFPDAESWDDEQSDFQVIADCWAYEIEDK